MKPKYITTTLPYVNSDPHIGFAYEVVLADTLTRHWRQMGHAVFFNTGTDEHGQKIAQVADAKGESRQAYVDHYANEFKRLADATGGLNLSYAEGGNFIRTTDTVHKAAAQKIWERCAANLNEAGESDIYKKKYSGLYCVGCELFYKESELDANKCCLIHGKSVQEIEEENYFFRLSRYQSYLEEYLAQPGVIEPEWRRQEAVNFVAAGLEDFSISREKVRLNWGIPVPGDDNQVMYVWFDALTNYISTLGWPDESGDFKRFWNDGEVVQLGGKDQIRFQSIMWQAMLKSAAVKATDKVIYHGFINSGGQKMSKSLGNVISPYELIARYGTDATRYLLLRHVHPFDDSDITWERLDEWYTADLVNGLGNLVARVMKMAETHLDGPIDLLAEKYNNSKAISPVVDAQLEQFNAQEALFTIWSYIKDVDEKIAESEPFKVIKVEPERAKILIQTNVFEVFEIAQNLQSFMPETAKIILEAVTFNKKPVNLFPRLEK